MTQAENDKTPRGMKSICPPLLLLIVAGLFVYRAYDYGDTARQLPMLVGAGALLLLLLDVLSRFDTKFSALARLALGAGFEDREMLTVPRWQSEIMQIAWLAACVAGIVLIGILPTIPLFVFLYIVIRGEQGITFSLFISLLVFLLVGLVFEVVLDYELYRGALFNRFGFE